MLDYSYVISFNRETGRYTVSYDNVIDGSKISMNFIVPDWAVNKFGANPKKLELVDEVEEILSLNYHFGVSSFQQQARKVQTTPEQAAGG